MNQLANYCNELFLAEGISLYRFCKNHHLERTSIRRLLNGERLPKENTFEAFADALTLTPEESVKLHELYQCQKLGKRRYENRIFIKEFLDDVGRNHNFQFQTNISSEYHSILLNTNAAKIDHPLELSYIFQHLFVIEENCVYSNIPADHRLFHYSVQEGFYENKHIIPFYHILTLLKQSDIRHDVNYNLSVLKNVAPFALQNHLNYQPFYFYGNQINKNTSAAFPYYLLTSNYLLLISADCNQGLLSTDATIIDAFHKQCQKTMKLSRPFIHHSASPTQLLEYYQSNLNRPSHPLFTFDFFPCLFKIYSRDLFLPQLTQEFADNEKLVQMVESLSLTTADYPPYEAFLSYEGLIHFAKTGELCQSCRHILTPFPVKERKIILKQVMTYCKEGSYHLHILPKNYFRNLPEINLEVFNDHRVTILSMNKENLFSFFYLNENSIYDSFLDYFESLLENPEVCSVKQSAQIISDIIKTYL